MKTEEMKLKDISEETLKRYLDNLQKERALPTSWKELKYPHGFYVDGLNGHVYKSGTTPFFSCEQLFATSKQAKASIALSQLSLLMAVYNDGWTPDWENNTDKWAVCFYHNRATTSISKYQHYFLTFKTRELSRKFLNNFRDLIEQAKPLL